MFYLKKKDKMNLKNKLMIALSATLMLWSCSDDDESTNSDIATISLSTDIIQVDKNGGDATVTVTSTGDWRLSGVCDWAYPSITSGKSGDVVTFTINASKVDEKRTATFKFFTGSSVAPLQIECEAGYMMNLLSDANPSISREKNMVKIELNTNIADPTITLSDGGEEWLTFDKRIDFGGKSIFSFTSSKNETYKNRSTTITFSSPLTAEPVNVKLTQEQTDAIISETNSLMYDLAARTISFKVKYNVDYTITIPQGDKWITNQLISEPQIGDDGLSTITLSYNLSNASITRGGIIRIAKTKGSLTNDVSIIQKDPDAELSEIPDNTLRSLCVSNGWVLAISDSKCVILEAGLEATSLTNTSYSNEINDFTGIENFPNLTTLNLGYCSNMKKFDISGLHKVSSLEFSSTRQCEEFNLGDNPITSFDAGGFYSYSYAESLKISGSKIEAINLSINSWYESSDKVTSIDVSECPSLKTLNAKRSNKITTLYLKTGQSIPELTKNTTTIIVYK